MPTLAIFVVSGTFLLTPIATADAQSNAAARPPVAEVSEVQRKDNRKNTPANVLTAEQWRRVDAAVSRALKWLATEQQPNGSFRTLDMGQPAISSLCIMAFMAHGHVPGQGPYGARLEKATEYVVSCQKPNGLVTKLGPD